MSKIVGQRIRKARLEVGLTQAQLGEKVGLTGGRIGQIETNTGGGAMVRDTKVVLIANALSTTVEALFGKRAAHRVKDVKQDRTRQMRAAA